jgi:hypothetical protein
MDTIVITTPEEAIKFREELKLEMKLTHEIIKEGLESNSDGLIITPAYILNQQKIISLVNAVSVWRQSATAKAFRIRQQMEELPLLLSILKNNPEELPEYLNIRDFAMREIPNEMLRLNSELLAMESK